MYDLQQEICLFTSFWRAAIGFVFVFMLNSFSRGKLNLSKITTSTRIQTKLYERFKNCFLLFCLSLARGCCKTVKTWNADVINDFFQIEIVRETVTGGDKM